MKILVSDLRKMIDALPDPKLRDHANYKDYAVMGELSLYACDPNTKEETMDNKVFRLRFEEYYDDWMLEI